MNTRMIKNDIPHLLYVVKSQCKNTLSVCLVGFDDILVSNKRQTIAWTISWSSFVVNFLQHTRNQLCMRRADERVSRWLGAYTK